MYDLLGLLVVLIWACCGTLLKQTIAFSSGEFMTVIVAYNFMASLFLLPFVLRKKTRLKITAVSQPVRFTGLILLNGFYDVAVGVAIALCFPVQYAIIANYLWPILIVVFLGVFTKKLSPQALLGSILGFIAIIVLFMPGGASKAPSVIGILFGVAAGVLWGLYSALMSLNKQYEPLSIPIQFFAQLVSGCVMLIITLSTDRFHIGSIANAPAIICLILYSIFTMDLAYILWIYVVTRHANMQKFASTTYLIPILSVTIASIYFKSGLDWKIWIALTFILLGIFVSRHKISTIK